MGKAFFTGWALWEKMVFVLACAIVVTIMLGCLKLVYSSWRIRKYASLPPGLVNNLDREKSIIRSLSRRSAKTPMVERQRRVREINDGIEVPFGIRAIESGIEVDGVWISRNNTPAPSTRESSANSLWGKLPNSSSNDLAQSGTQDTPGYHSIPATASSSRAPSRNLDRSFSSESVLNDPSSPDVIAQPAKPRYPPHSYIRYENTRHFRNSHTLENRDRSRSRPTSSYFSSDATGSSTNRNSGSGSDSSRHGSSGSNEFPAQQSSPYQDVLTYQPRSTSNSDFDMLQTHRLSHVAETGQLIPRIRRPGHSGEWASVANFTPIVSGEVINFSIPRPVTPSGPPSDSGSNPFRTPVSPDSPGFPESNKSRTSNESHLPNVRPTSNGHTYDRPDANVLREVNSGFSILRPGTLDAQLQAQTQRRPQQARSRSRSVSFDGDSEKRRGKRLQKKRRPSVDSRRSSVSDKGITVLEALQGPMYEDGARYAFAEGDRPPSATNVVEGAQIEAAGGKYKF